MLAYILTGLLNKSYNKQKEKIIEEKYDQDKKLTEQEDKAFNVGKEFAQNRYIMPNWMSGAFICGGIMTIAAFCNISTIKNLGKQLTEKQMTIDSLKNAHTPTQMDLKKINDSTYVLRPQ